MFLFGARADARADDVLPPGGPPLEQLALWGDRASGAGARASLFPRRGTTASEAAQDRDLGVFARRSFGLIRELLASCLSGQQQRPGSGPCCFVLPLVCLRNVFSFLFYLICVCAL